MPQERPPTPGTAFPSATFHHQRFCEKESGQDAPPSVLTTEDFEDQLPDEPLLFEDMQLLDNESCLNFIETRHHLQRTRLFTHTQQPDRIWDEENLAKLALMRLEGASMHDIAAHFATEISLLHRTPDYIVSAVSLRQKAYKYFSKSLKQKIKSNRQSSWWSIAASISDKNLIPEIEKATGLNKTQLFTRSQHGRNTRHRDDTDFSLEMVLRAFLLRINGSSYRSIFSKFGRDYTTKSVSNLKSLISQRFSQKARECIPYNMSKIDSSSHKNLSQ